MASAANPLITSYEWPDVTENCGGGGRVAQTLVDGLEEIGHEPIVHTDDEDGHMLSFPVREYSDMQQLIRDHRPTVIHGHFSIPTSLLLPQLARQADVPLVITVMGTDIYNPVRYRRVRPVLSRVNDYVLSQADAVVAPSRDLQERVAKIAGIKCKRIPHGIDTNAYEWQSKTLHDPVRILTVSRFARGKQLDVAIEAVEELRNRINAELRIVGDGPLFDDLHRRYGDRDWLSMPGWAEDVQRHYEWGNIFFLPTKWEAFGLVFCEALASGLPVVTTRTGGQTDIVKGNVGRLAHDDPGECADALADVVENYHWLHSNTEGYVEERFSKAEMVRRYNNLYMELR